MGAITKDSKSELVILDSNVTGQTYRQLLQEHAIPFARLHLPGGFYYQDDNATAHRAATVKNFLAAEGIHCLPWPAQSPDMNPIEHMWDVLGRRIQERSPPPSTLQELRLALQHEWDAIPQEIVRDLIQGMPRRISALLQSGGSHTKY